MNPDAKERLAELRALEAQSVGQSDGADTPSPQQGVDTGATVGSTEESEGGLWDHIPAQQILVIQQGDRVFGAVTVDTPEGRTLYSREPCPTCGQDWTHSPDGRDVKILWPDTYKTG